MSESQHFEVHGRVTGQGGREAHHAQVIVWWKRIRRQVQLEDGTTSEDGEYRIRYKLPEDAPQPVLILVEARSEHFPGPSSLR